MVRDPLFGMGGGGISSLTQRHGFPNCDLAPGTVSKREGSHGLDRAGVYLRGGSHAGPVVLVRAKDMVR